MVVRGGYAHKLECGPWIGLLLLMLMMMTMMMAAS